MLLIYENAECYTYAHFFTASSAYESEEKDSAGMVHKVCKLWLYDLEHMPMTILRFIKKDS